MRPLLVIVLGLSGAACAAASVSSTPASPASPQAEEAPYSPPGAPLLPGPPTVMAPPGTAGDAAPTGVVYACAMHPDVTAAAPGRCPRCGMTLHARPPDAAAP